MARINPAPCSSLPALFTCHPSFLLPAFLLTWRTSFLSRGANAHPLLSLVCYQLPNLCYFSHPNTPHRSIYNIYIDDINNTSHPRLTHYPVVSITPSFYGDCSLLDWAVSMTPPKLYFSVSTTRRSLDYAVSMEPLSFDLACQSHHWVLTPQCKWHRWVSFRVVNNTAKHRLCIVRSTKWCRDCILGLMYSAIWG